MRLSHTLAQEIVNKIIPVLDLNINIMDETGFIIGTGDQERLFTKHEGAIQVLKVSSTIEVFKDSNLVGTKPGINLPIYFDRQIIGVVGITGDPQTVHPYAKMVKVHTEMLVEKNYLHKKILEDSNAKDQLLFDIINNHFKTEEQIIEAYARCAILNLNLNNPGVPILIEIIPQGNSSSQKVIQQLEGYVLKLREKLTKLTTLNDYRYFTQLSSYRFMLVLELTKLPLSFQKNEIVKRTHEFFRKLPKDLNMNLHVGIGSITEKLEDYPEAYKNADFALSIKKNQTGHQINYYDDVGILEVLQNVTPFIKNAFTKDISPVLLEEPKLVEALTSYIEENGNLTKAAEKIGVQRVTLINRLEKIKTLVGKDPRNLKDLLELYTALLILLPSHFVLRPD